MSKQIIKTAIKSGHFELSSGLHSSSYIQCAKLCEDPKICRQLAKELSYKLPLEFKNREDLVVISPAIGAVLFGYEVASELGLSFVFAERNKERKLELKRGFSVVGKKVIIIEDVITTMKTVNEICELVGSENVVGIGCMVNRSNLDDLYSLDRMTFLQYKGEECPLCLEGIPLEKPGSR